MVTKYPVVFRIPVADLAKLDTIAAKTCRSRADLLRLLVALAQESGVPDVCLSGKEAEPA